MSHGVASSILCRVHVFTISGVHMTVIRRVHVIRVIRVVSASIDWDVRTSHQGKVIAPKWYVFEL